MQWLISQSASKVLWAMRNFADRWVYLSSAKLGRGFSFDFTADYVTNIVYVLGLVYCLHGDIGYIIKAHTYTSVSISRALRQPSIGVLFVNLCILQGYGAHCSLVGTRPVIP